MKTINNPKKKNKLIIIPLAMSAVLCASGVGVGVYYRNHPLTDAQAKQEYDSGYQDCYDDNVALRDKMAGYVKQIETLTAEKAALQTQLTTANADIVSLNNQITVLNNQISAKTTAIQNLETQITSKTTEVSNLTAEKTQLESEKLELQAQLTTANADIVSLNNQITNKSSTIAILETQISSKTTEVSNLTAEKTQLESEKLELQSQIETLTAEKTALQTQVDNLTFEVQRLNGELAAYSESSQIAVSFRIGNDLYATKLVNSGACVTDLTTPENTTAYDFVGWYQEGDTSQTIVDVTTQTITSATTYVAKIRTEYEFYIFYANEDNTFTTIQLAKGSVLDSSVIEDIDFSDDALSGSTLTHYEIIGWRDGLGSNTFDNLYDININNLTADANGARGITPIYQLKAEINYKVDDKIVSATSVNVGDNLTIPSVVSNNDEIVGFDYFVGSKCKGYVSLDDLPNMTADNDYTLVACVKQYSTIKYYGLNDYDEANLLFEDKVEVQSYSLDSGTLYGVNEIYTVHTYPNLGSNYRNYGWNGYMDDGLGNRASGDNITSAINWPQVYRFALTAEIQNTYILSDNNLITLTDSINSSNGKTYTNSVNSLKTTDELIVTVNSLKYYDDTTGQEKVYSGKNCTPTLPIVSSIGIIEFTTTYAKCRVQFTCEANNVISIVSNYYDFASYGDDSFWIEQLSIKIEVNRWETA